MTDQPPVESGLVKAAEQTVDKLTQAVRRNRAWNITLSIILAVVIALGVLLGVVVYRGHQLVDTVRAGAISSCQSGNVARATNQKIWDEFLTILVTNPELGATRARLEADVKALRLPANEAQAFNDIIVANWSADAGSVKLVQGFETYIAMHEKQQRCQQIYGS